MNSQAITIVLPAPMNEAIRQLNQRERETGEALTLAETLRHLLAAGLRASKEAPE